MPKVIKWKSDVRKLSDLKPWPKNPRKMSDSQFEMLIREINELGFTNPIIIDTNDMIIAGHQRRKAMYELGREDELVPVRIPERPLTKEEFERIAIGDNKFIGEFAPELLNGNFDVDFLLSTMKFEQWELGTLKNDLFDARGNMDIDESEQGATSYEIPDENAPDQDQFDKQPGNSIEDDQPSEEKQMPFEVMLNLSTRKRMFDVVKEIKDNYNMETTNSVFSLLISIYEKAKDHPEFKELF